MKKDGYVKIDGAVGKNYILTKDDVNKFIQVEVTPASDNEPITVHRQEVKMFFRDRRRLRKILKSQKNGSRLTGSYEFSQKRRRIGGRIDLHMVCKRQQGGNRH